jgi:hypothetical protein
MTRIPVREVVEGEPVLERCGYCGERGLVKREVVVRWAGGRREELGRCPGCNMAIVAIKVKPEGSR